MNANHRLSLPSVESPDDKRRGWTITIVIHALIFLLGLLPFMLEHAKPEFTRAIVIEFDEAPSTMKSGRAQASASSRAARPKTAIASVRPVKMARTMPVPKRQQVMTSIEPDMQRVEYTDDYFSKPLDVPEVEQPEEVEEMPQEVVEITSVQEFEEVFDVEEVGEQVAEIADAPDPVEPADGDFADGTGTGSSWLDADVEEGDEGIAPLEGDGSYNDGMAGEGDGSMGEDSGVGNQGKGMQWGDIAGDGLFNRKVIKRANAARLAVEEGRIVVMLCVNQDGEVVDAEYDRAGSTLSNPSLVSKAEECASRYVFEYDASAPEKQCGKLTFIFEIDE